MAEMARVRDSPPKTTEPHSLCLPHGFMVEHTWGGQLRKIVQTRGLVLILGEYNSMFRQVFTDGRPLPTDPNPAWNGYSIGKWDGDDFVVTTAGINDQVWNIDLAGHPHSDVLRVTERFHRVDFGHMDIQVTIDDSKTWTKPWVMPVMRYTLLPDTDLLEFVCEKNRNGYGGR